MVTDNLIFSLRATMPLFFMMVLGFFLKKIKFITPDGTKVLNRIVYRVFLPVLLFKDLSTQDFGQVWDTAFVLFCLVVTILSIAIATLLSLLDKNKFDRGEIIQAAYRSGAASLGIAFMSNIYQNVSMVALMIIASVPLYNIAAVTVLSLTSPDNERFANKKELAKHTAVSIITNPILIGVIIGTLWAFLKIPQPVVMTKTVSSIAGVATPLGLVALGSSFEFSNVKVKLKPIILVTFCKLFLFVGAFLPIAINMGFRDEKLVAILIMLGSATTNSCYIMSKNMGHEGAISSSAVIITTILSSFTLTLWLFILKSFMFI